MRHLVAAIALTTLFASTATADTPPTPGNTAHRPDPEATSSSPNPYSTYSELARIDAEIAKHKAAIDVLEGKRTTENKKVETDRAAVAAQRDALLNGQTPVSPADEDKEIYAWLGAVENDKVKVTYSNAAGQRIAVSEDTRLAREQVLVQAIADIEKACKGKLRNWELATVVFTVTGDKVTGHEVREKDPVTAEVNQAATCLEQNVTDPPNKWAVLELAPGETATAAMRVMFGP